MQIVPSSSLSGCSQQQAKNATYASWFKDRAVLDALPLYSGLDISSSPSNTLLHELHARRSLLPVNIQLRKTFAQVEQLGATLCKLALQNIFEQQMTAYMKSVSPLIAFRYDTASMQYLTGFVTSV